MLAEKRMECEFVIDSPTHRQRTVPEYNPLGKIPVLVLDDDITIFDSRVIVEYLDNASPGNRLIPEEKRPRIQVRRWEALADGCTDAAVAVVMEKRRPRGKQQSPEWISRQQGKIDRALQVMADELGSHSVVQRAIFSRWPTSRSAAPGLSRFASARRRLARNLSEPGQAADKLAQAPVVPGHGAARLDRIGISLARRSGSAGRLASSSAWPRRTR